MKDRIWAIMKSKGMTQVEFAEKTGISQSSLSGVFKGRTNPSNSQIMALHAAFPEISIAWLMFGEGDMVDVRSGQSAAVDGGAEVDSVNTRSMEPLPPVTSSATGEAMASMFSDEDFAPAAAAPRQAERPVHAAVLPPRPVAVTPQTASVVKNVNIVDKPARRIKEIRVFFDDGTYEAFVPSAK